MDREELAVNLATSPCVLAVNGRAAEDLSAPHFALRWLTAPNRNWTRASEVSCSSKQKGAITRPPGTCGSLRILAGWRLAPVYPGLRTAWRQTNGFFWPTLIGSVANFHEPRRIYKGFSFPVGTDFQASFNKEFVGLVIHQRRHAMIYLQDISVACHHARQLAQ